MFSQQSDLQTADLSEPKSTQLHSINMKMKKMDTDSGIVRDQTFS